MKKLLTIFGAIIIVLTSCSESKPAKTIESLKAAYNGESTASAKYMSFAEKSLKDGDIAIAKMFLATAKAESIHAANHKKVLEKLGVKVDGAVIGEFEVKTVRENLLDGIKGESYEVLSMYPEFLKLAKLENNADAKKSFTWALDTEKKHKDFYQQALEAYNAGKIKNTDVNWYVCPICGNTYKSEVKQKACDFCNTSKEKFIGI
jgi:rubrerythrin